MATIQSQLKLNDGMSPVLKKITSAMDICLSSFEQMQVVSGQAMDVGAIAAARAELIEANSTIEEMERNLRDVEDSQNGVNRAMQDGQNAAGGLLGKITGIAAAYGAVLSVTRVMSLADEMTKTTARLNIMNDGLQTTAELQRMIYYSAQRSRMAYQQTADLVTKLGLHIGHLFDSNAELVGFVEQLNKTFGVAGTSAQGVESTIYNMVQALSSGALRGQNLNVVFANAMPIIKNIADYMGVCTDQIRDMAAEGLITTDVIKGAMFAAAEETSAAFAKIPMTFAQVKTVASNALLQAAKPAIQLIGQGAQWIYENWSRVAPVFYGAAGAILAFAVAMKIKALAATVAKGSLMGLFVVMLKNPFTWIALLIGVIIFWIYRWIQSVGGLQVAWLMVVNWLMTGWDWVKIMWFTGVNFVLDLWDKLVLRTVSGGTTIVNFMGDMRANVLMILQNMVNGAIDIINGFISAVNKIPGVSIDAIAHVTFATTAQANNLAAQQARNAALDAQRAQVDANIANRAASLAQRTADARAATAYRQAGIDYARAAAGAAGDPGLGFGGMTDFAPYEPQLNEIAENTGSAAGALRNMSEDIAHLISIAERQAVDRATSVRVTVDMSGMSNTVNTPMDLDGMISRITDSIEEAVQSGAEGVYA